ncbi:MAG: hypothetical protein WCD31_11855 [Gillisia sp.]
MKKDIVIPEVKDVFVAAIREKNEDFQSMDWNAYLINNQERPLEMVLIVAKGYSQKQLSSTLRHSIKVLPAKSFAKIEFLQDDVLKLNNEFYVTFFVGNKMFEKRFVFKKNSIRESALSEIPLMKERGVLAE